MALPDPQPGQAADPEFLKLLYQAQLQDETNRGSAEQKAELETEAALNLAVHNARLDGAMAAIDRGRSGAEFVRNAAAGIVTLYTGILGVTFATGKDATPLPARGLAPAILLQERRLNACMAWVSKIAFTRGYFLHASVISLGFGVLLLPAPFIAIADWVALVIVVLALAVTLLTPRLTTR